uniref:ATP synthase F0 subunit 8 n=1 Tax=Parasipyloidea carinata TaxID=3126553 RepID=UPI00315D5A8A
MPQMMPMSWMIIYIYFMFVMITFIVKLYFNKYTTKTSSTTTINYSKETNWKW